MNIATGAMNTLLPKLGELLVGEYKLQKGVKGEIEELEKELKGMNAALHKVAETPVDQLDQQVKIWASEVRELSYDIEDAIDTFMLKCKGHEPATSFKKVTNLFNKFKTNHQIHGVMKDIMDQVKKELKAKFDSYCFVSVSLNPDINKILKNILLQLDEKMYSHIDETWETKQLIDKIRDFLNNRRFLCVIDDVWKKSAWDTIKLAVQDAKLGSKIIVTTRNKVVAEHAGGGVYEMKPLSDDDSRQLFCKRIFDSNDDCPADLCGVTEKILKKCGGVPLAIITTACLLASKPRNSEEWDKVNKSISLGLENNLDVDNMRKILSLSYNDLPFHLKTCLLSLSKYPEDELIRKDVLIWDWFAEGFITDETRPAGTSLQEIGESYFSELINRSLIQPMSVYYLLDDGKVHQCKVHDMVLELINQLSVEEDFVTTYLSDGQQTGKHTCTAQKKKIRRLSLHNSNKSYASPEAREQLSKLEDCSGMDKNHLNHLDKLRLLRFLRLGHYSATKLPESIGKLESLETLDIRGARKPNSSKSHKSEAGTRSDAKGYEIFTGACNRSYLKEIIDMQQVPFGLQRLFMHHSYMKAFPCWINSSMLSRLTTLSICLDFEYLQSDHLDRLAELPSLRFLRLQLAFVSEQLQEKLTIHRGACAFRSLKDFHFYSCMMPSFQPGAMPHLERLCLRIGTRLRRGDLNDLGLENLHSLRHVTIDYMGENTAVIEEALKDYPNQAALELLLR
uniref:NB-ARC domain containing protein n=1 Tax=Oryza sativa subsp. japonica TaxID=39947 RepID=Q2QNU3_ORYSJ|nr:NB-ARC domain containing protein [Oryza sativa Japonica Group]